MNSVDPILVDSEHAMVAFGADLAADLGDDCVMTLSGDLGSGKTTIARGVLRGLGFAGRVKSPTYTLVETYECAGKSIYHFDFYRIQDAEELELVGIAELLTKPVIRIIEWPNLGGPYVPAVDLAIAIKTHGDARRVWLQRRSVDTA